MACVDRAREEGACAQHDQAAPKHTLTPHTAALRAGVYFDTLTTGDRQVGGTWDISSESSPSFVHDYSSSSCPSTSGVGHTSDATTDVASTNTTTPSDSPIGIV